MLHRFLLLTMTSLSLISCGGSGGGGNGGVTNFDQYFSPNDPCNIEGACTNAKKINFKQALSLLKATVSTPEKGLLDSSRIETSENIWDINSDIPKVCGISYDQARLLVDFDANYIYVEEKKSNFAFKPDSAECRRIQENDENFGGEYASYFIAKEDRIDLTAPTAETLAFFERLNFQTVDLAGFPTLKVSGIIETKGTYRLNNGQEVQFSNKLSNFLMSRLDVNNFHSEVVAHTIFVEKKLNIFDEFFSKTRGIQTGVDVTHIDITTIPAEDLYDRTSSNDDELQTSSTDREKSYLSRFLPRL